MAAEIDVPSYFLCPISLQIMKDPVTLSTGITYDRDSIEEWIFSQKNDTCPVTKQVITNHTSSADQQLTPNVTLRRLIQSWCTLHAVERLPTPKAPVSRSQLSKLLKDADAPSLQIKSLQTLKSIASQNQTNKRSMETAGAAQVLSSLIVRKTLEASRADVPEDLSDSQKARDEALSILYSLQLSDSGLNSLNRPEFVDSLTRAMQYGSYESRAYAAMLLESMVDVADPSLLINLKTDLLSELSQILKDQISQKSSKATLKILINACPWGRNRIKAVEAGAVPVLIDLLLHSSDKRACELILIVLDLLCQCADGRAELLKHSAGLAVVSKKILRVSNVGSERAVRILHFISKFSATPGIIQEMLQIGVAAKLCLVLQVDCGLKMKERAREMLRVHSRAWRNSSCIPSHLISSYPS